mgnify:CR=1 FL=1
MSETKKRKCTIRGNTLYLYKLYSFIEEIEIHSKQLNIGGINIEQANKQKSGFFNTIQY